MERSSGKKKSFKNIVKFNNFADIDISKIAIGASVGLFMGCIGGVFSQIAKIDFSGDTELDPPAPNMQVFFFIHT